jgi:DNA-binding phage protein
MASDTLAFDAAVFIETPEDGAEFLADAFESGHPGAISATIAAVARAKRASAKAPDGIEVV